MSANPIGRLIVDAEKQGKKKPSKTHTAKAPCGCQVTVTWLSSESRSNDIAPCDEHVQKERS